MHTLTIQSNLKAFVVTFLCVISCTTLCAQNMKVLQFRELTNDLTANLYGTSKTDENGEVAALIKIVTTEKGFTFDGGSLGIVATEYKAGEIWLYVPRRTQRLTITHNTFGVLRNYVYPVPIEGGKTYEMLIDIGIGRYVTITSSVANATIFVDGEECGTSPVRKYISYGSHVIKGVKDRFEGETTALVSTTSQEKPLVHVEMQDMSSHYGDVVVTVYNRADIFYNGQNMGTGEWRTQLREGNYTIETRKANSDPAMTSFTVVAQQQNSIKANAPIPHTGWLHVYTRPRNVKISPVNVSETQTLPVGTHQLEFSRKGYVTQNKEYTVRRNETTRDTVTLQRVTYVKPLAFYFGGAFTLRSLSGVSAIVGAVYQRHDLQASYTFGLDDSDVIYWGGEMNTGTKYKMQSVGVKYGYQFPLMRHIAITPQVGWSYNFLTANAAQDGNTTYGDGTSSHAVTVGAKLVLVPMQHVYLFVAPELMFAASKAKNFETIVNNSNISADGFVLHAGLLVNF